MAVIYVCTVWSTECGDVYCLEVNLFRLLSNHFLANCVLFNYHETLLHILYISYIHLIVVLYLDSYCCGTYSCGTSSGST